MKPAPERSYPAERLYAPVGYFHIGQFTKGSHGIDLFKSGLKQGHTAGNVLMIISRYGQWQCRCEFVKVLLGYEVIIKIL